MSTDSNMAATSNFDLLHTIPADLLKKLGADRPSTAALMALRKIFSDEAVFRLAADLPRARHKLRNKLLYSQSAFADIGRAEMATARPVALYRMARLLQAAGKPVSGQPAPTSPAPIHDMGCGAGGDFCALLEAAQFQALPTASMAAGLHAWEIDPFAAWCARQNAQAVWSSMPAETVQCADVATLNPDAGFLGATCLFMDPTRRSQAAAGRPMRPGVNDWSRCAPPSSLWAPWIDQGARVAMKVASAFDWRGFDPATIAPQAGIPQVEAIEWRGEVHELALWWNFARQADTCRLTDGPVRRWGTVAETAAACAAATEFGPGRRATVIAGNAQDSFALFRVDTLFLPANQVEAARMALTFDDRPAEPGDWIAIPSPALLRMDLAPAVAQILGAPALAGQPHLMRIPPAQAQATAASLLVKCGRVVEVVAAREKDLRRALNSTLQHYRWQPQVLGVKGAQGLEKLMRQIEHHTATEPIGGGATPAGVALITRIFHSHLILFLALGPETIA